MFIFIYVFFFNFFVFYRLFCPPSASAIRHPPSAVRRPPSAVRIRRPHPHFTESTCPFYKLPNIGYYSSYTGRKISSLLISIAKTYVKIIFSPFKFSSMFSPKDFVPDSLKWRVVYQFTCATAVELVILLKPIGILTRVLMSISFGTKIPTTQCC